MENTYTFDENDNLVLKNVPRNATKLAYIRGFEEGYEIGKKEGDKLK